MSAPNQVLSWTLETRGVHISGQNIQESFMELVVLGDVDSQGNSYMRKLQGACKSQGPWCGHGGWCEVAILILLFEQRPRGVRNSQDRGKGPGVECAGGLHNQQGGQCGTLREGRRNIRSSNGQARAGSQSQRRTLFESLIRTRNPVSHPGFPHSACGLATSPLPGGGGPGGAQTLAPAWLHSQPEPGPTKPL